MVLVPPVLGLPPSAPLKAALVVTCLVLAGLTKTLVEDRFREHRRSPIAPRDRAARRSGAVLVSSVAVTAILAGADAAITAGRYPESALAWATLAEAALVMGFTVEAYAYARTGYHRSLDQLRRAGWKGAGPVPCRH